jgi:hypothetical protein
MSDDQLDRYFSDLLVSHRNRQRAISIRFPEELLVDLQRLAQQAGLGYQTLIKKLLERDVEQLRAPRRSAKRLVSARATTSRRSTSTTPARRKRTNGTATSARTKRRKNSTPKVPA